VVEVTKVFSIWIAAVCASFVLLVLILVALRLDEPGHGSTGSRPDADEPKDLPRAA
jgi:hypothetical protein